MKVRFSDFTQITRSASGLPRELDAPALLQAAGELISKADIIGQPIRLMGLTVSKIVKSESHAGNSRQLLIDFDE